MLTSILYSIKQAFKQVGRNGAMSIASVFSITAMLLILGVFFISIVNINLAMEKTKQDYDQIQIYLLDSTEYAEAENILNEMKSMPEVSDAYYLSKEDALEDWKSEWGDSAYLLDSLQTNPLPNAIVISVAELSYSDAVAEKAETLDGVEDVVYYRDTVEKLAKVTDALQLAAWVIMAFLVFVSVVVVSNTIKLTVFARKDEINIMKYVGATNWFIRGPFLVEGMIIGLVSAIISAGISALIYHKVVDLIGTDIFLMFKMNMVPEGFLSYNLVLIFIAIGISIGACGSIISMRRFLDT